MTLRCDTIKPTIWQNVGEKGAFFATSFSDRFKDQSGPWHRKNVPPDGSVATSDPTERVMVLQPPLHESLSQTGRTSRCCRTRRTGCRTTCADTVLFNLEPVRRLIVAGLGSIRPGGPVCLPPVIARFPLPAVVIPELSPDLFRHGVFSEVLKLLFLPGLGFSRFQHYGNLRRSRLDISPWMA